MDFIPEDFLKIGLALVIGALIGAEREYRNKSAGFRTVMLITLGSCIFTILSIAISPANPDRIAANIVTGIGFLGAGAIFREENKVSGLTTAASIWAAAALGMAIGSGHYLLAAGGMVLIMIILFALTGIETRIDRKHKVRRYKIVTKFDLTVLHRFQQTFDRMRLFSERGTQSRIGDELIGTWMVTGSEADHEKLIETLLNDPDVKEFDF
jgi:putative Mg2+ transporter-C (MgtC) family protein